MRERETFLPRRNLRRLHGRGNIEIGPGRMVRSRTSVR